MIPGRCHDHPVRLVGNQNFLIPVKDHLLIERIRLRGDLLAVEDGDAVEIGRILPDRRAVVRRDETARDSLTPDVWGHLRKMLDQVREDGRRGRLDLGEMEPGWRGEETVVGIGVVVHAIVWIVQTRCASFRLLPATSLYSKSRQSSAPLNSGVRRDALNRISLGRRMSAEKM